MYLIVVFIFSVYMNFRYLDYRLTTGTRISDSKYSYLNDRHTVDISGHPSNYGDRVRVLYDKNDQRYAEVVEEHWINSLAFLFFAPLILAAIASIYVIVKQGTLSSNAGIQAGVLWGLYAGGLAFVADYRFLLAGFWFDVISWFFNK